MSWKTILVTSSEHLFLKNNQLHFVKDNTTACFPISDINCVIIENTATKITMPLLNALVQAHVFVLFCDHKHDPSGIVLPFHSHWQPLTIFNYQINLGAHFKKQTWTSLIRRKILNQLLVCKHLAVDEQILQKMQHFYDHLSYNDARNYEGISAHLFFRALYGSSFVRHTDTGINAALNYGYKIVLSALSRTLVKYGLTNYLGIRHIGNTNPFNLASDFIEPLRPLVDYFVSRMGEAITDKLIYNQRLQLVKILHTKVFIQHQQHTLINAIDIMIKSFITALKQNDSQFFALPRLFFDNAY